MYSYLLDSGWCLVCDAVPKSICRGSHIVVDVMKDVAELKLELTETKMEVSIHLNEAVAKREQTQEHLQVLIIQNSTCLQKLQSKIQSYGTDALHYVVPLREVVGSSSIKNGLKKAVNEAKEESYEAGRLLNQVIAVSENAVVTKSSGYNSVFKSSMLFKFLIF